MVCGGSFRYRRKLSAERVHTVEHRFGLADARGDEGWCGDATGDARTCHGSDRSTDRRPFTGREDRRSQAALRKAGGVEGSQIVAFGLVDIGTAATSVLRQGRREGELAHAFGHATENSERSFHPQLCKRTDERARGLQTEESAGWSGIASGD